jgi:superfamily II DNA or RNA helicase
VPGDAIAFQLGTRFLIIVDKEFLMNQWKGEIESLMPGLRIGILQADTHQYGTEVLTTKGPNVLEMKKLAREAGLKVGGNKDVLVNRLMEAKIDVAPKTETIEYDCTLCMIQTLCSRDYPDGFFADYGFTIFDECHHLGAAHFSRALQKIQTKYLLGLSATPTREDGMTQVFEAFLGKPVYWEKRREADPTVMVRAITYHDFADPEWADVPTDYTGDVILARLLTKIVESPARTALIVRLLVELCAEGTRQILVLSERKVLLEAVEAALPPTIKQGYYIGGMKDEIRERNAKEAQVLLATYSMASDALNIKSLNCVILASPRKRVEQSTGRILRQRPEERTLAPLIVDIVDVHDTYKNMYRKRAEYYKQCGYQISIEKTGSDGKIQVVRSARPAVIATAEEAENEIIQRKTVADGDECVIKI